MFEVLVLLRIAGQAHRRRFGVVDHLDNIDRRYFDLGIGRRLMQHHFHRVFTDHGAATRGFVAARPVEEIHLGGHTLESDGKGGPLLIDTHDRPVDDVVWEMFVYAIERLGPLPVLIERDSNIPAWPELEAEAGHAEALMLASTAKPRHAAVG